MLNNITITGITKHPKEAVRTISTLFKEQHEYHIAISEPYEKLYSDCWGDNELIDLLNTCGSWCVFCAYNEQTLCGFIVICDDETPNHGYIPELYVSPAYRGHGIATQLINAAHSFKPYDTIRLEVMTGNESVIELYKQCGYKPAALMMYKDNS